MAVQVSVTCKIIQLVQLHLLTCSRASLPIINLAPIDKVQDPRNRLRDSKGRPEVRSLNLLTDDGFPIIRTKAVK